MTLEDIRIECVGAGASREAVVRPGQETAGLYPEATMFGAYRLPAYGLYVDRPEDVKLKNVSFGLRPGTTDDRPAVN